MVRSTAGLDREGVNVFHRRRFLALTGVAILSLSISVSSAASESQVVDLLAVAPSTGQCQGMDMVEASERFKHLDGSPSDLSEWKHTDIGLAHRGPIVRGRVPAGNFFIYGKSQRKVGRLYTLEGVLYKGRNFEIICTPDMGVYHTKFPPRECLVTVKDAIKEIGGRKDGKGWSQGSVEPFSGVSSILGYYRRSSRFNLGSFTVPFQAQVIIHESEEQFDVYGPGDSVPPSHALVIICYI